MQEVEQICFNIICNAGEARSLYVEAIKHAQKGEFEEAKEKIKKGKDLLNSTHKVHFEMVQEEAKGNKVEVGLLLIHAEDMMMSAETLGIIAESMLEDKNDI